MFKATRAALTAEESKVERLKTQLKELFRFSQDMQPLSDSVIRAIREYQRYFSSREGQSFKINGTRELDASLDLQKQCEESMHSG